MYSFFVVCLSVWLFSHCSVFKVHLCHCVHLIVHSFLLLISVPLYDIMVNFSVNLAGLRDTQIAGKSSFLSMSVGVF